MSGALWRDALVMYDRETGSLWSQVNGEAIKGTLAGRALEKIPATVTTWKSWRELHPDTLVLVKPKGTEESAYGDYASDPRKLGIFGTRNPDRRLAGKEMVLGVALGDHAAAFPVSRLKQARVATAVVGSTPVMVFYDTEAEIAVAYRGEAQGRRLTFSRKGDPPNALRDDQTGTAWDLRRGVATGGPLAGARLEPLASTSAYWFAWAAFYPHTAVWEASGVERGR